MRVHVLWIYSEAIERSMSSTCLLLHRQSSLGSNKPILDRFSEKSQHGQKLLLEKRSQASVQTMTPTAFASVVTELIAAFVAPCGTVSSRSYLGGAGRTRPCSAILQSCVQIMGFRAGSMQAQQGPTLDLPTGFCPCARRGSASREVTEEKSKTCKECLKEDFRQHQRNFGRRR